MTEQNTGWRDISTFRETVKLIVRAEATGWAILGAATLGWFGLFALIAALCGGI